MDNGSERCEVRICLVRLGTPRCRNKAFAMSDAGQHCRLLAELRELIERASSAAEANLHQGLKPYPLGFAVRADGSRFVFEPVNIQDNDALVALIRTSFLQQNVTCYVLTLGATSAGRRYVLFSAEYEFGPMMVGHREIILHPAPHLGPLEILESNLVEGRFVGLLPRQVAHGIHQ